METGLLRQKGRVHFHLGACINSILEPLRDESRAEVARQVCSVLDRSIHCGYRIYPCNYIAYDEVFGTSHLGTGYTDDDLKAFNEYLDKQLDKVELTDVTPEERAFMRETMLVMYANPLQNQKTALNCSTAL